MTLKTLKDIRVVGNTTRNEVYSKTGRTFGDISNKRGQLVFVNELKELAIKWVKVNLYAIDKPKEDCPIVTWNYSIAFMNNWIKQFFNITEEDLK